MATIFGKRKNLWELSRVSCIYTLQAKKFRWNRSISHGLGDTSNFKFYQFCQKFKMAAIFGKRKIFLRIEQSILHI